MGVTLNLKRLLPFGAIIGKKFLFAVITKQRNIIEHH